MGEFSQKINSLACQSAYLRSHEKIFRWTDTLRLLLILDFTGNGSFYTNVSKFGLITASVQKTRTSSNK